MLLRDLTVRGNGAQIVLPQLANPAAVRFTGGRGHIITDKRFNGGFIRADAENVSRDFQLVEQGFVVQAVGRKTMQVNRALWREPDFIRKAGQIILPLAVAIAYRNHRLAAVAEFAQRFADVLH